MEQILKNKTNEVLQECIDYLDGKRPEFEKNFIMGRLSILIELLKIESNKETINIVIDKIELPNMANREDIVKELKDLPYKAHQLTKDIHNKWEIKY